VDQSQRTILFLIADTGAGHRSAANAIRNAITLISQQEQEQWRARREGEHEALLSSEPPPTYRIEIVDVFDEYAQFPLREAAKLYGPVIRYNPRLFGRFYHSINSARRVSAVQSVAHPMAHNGLLRLFTTLRPDVIVSVHPLLNHITVEVLRDLGCHIPFVTVVTDLVSVHYTWFAPGADCYIVPTEEAKQVYLSRGLDERRVHVLGMPIDPKFSRPTESKEALREKFGLRADVPVALLVGGGDGAGGLHDAVRAISRARLPIQLLIVTGRNRRLYARLQRTRSSLHVPARVFGFVQNMPEMMRAADVIVTKAGPGTIMEALACGLPIVLSGYVPGQEEGNVDFVLNNGVGTLARDPIELVDALRLLLKPGSELMQQQRENAQKLSRPRASFDIARYILSCIKNPAATGDWQTARTRRKRLAAFRPLRAEVRLRRLRRRLPRMTQLNVIRDPVMRRLTHLRTQGIRARTRASKNRQDGD
jgi:1,2-diacylglycerol 3-beta-galactosyltransferase